MSNQQKNTYRFLFYTEEGGPFSYYIDPITKEAYEYWEANGGMKALLNHFHKMSGVISARLLKADDSTELQKILDSEFPDIPTEARVLPTDPDSLLAESVYWYSSFGCDLIFNWNKRTLQNYIVEVYESSTNNLVWKGSLEDLVQNNPNAIIKAKYRTYHAEGYYSHFIQSEDAVITENIEIGGEWDPSRLHIKVKIDPVYGKCLNMDSFYYLNEQEELVKLDLEWDYYRSNLHPSNLLDHIQLCEPG